MLAIRRHFAPLILFALACQLVLSLPAFPGLVLCVGSDGHVAVESGGCADESSAAATRCDEFGRSAPCTDTPLAAHELVSGAGLRAGDHHVTAALAPPFAAAPATGLATSHRALASALVDPGRSRRSSILRL